VPDATRSDCSAVLTTCPFCGCGCGLYLHNDGTGLVGVSPSAYHPVADGRLCARGWAAHEGVRWGERLGTPLIRNCSGLVESSWREALDRVAARLSACRDSTADIGLLASPRCSNEESYLLARLARGTLATPHVDTFGSSTYVPWLEGLRDATGRAVPVGSLAAVAECDVALVVEGDVAESHPRAASLLLRALRGGARVIVVGAQPTQLARLASIHLRVPLGGEAGALAALLATLGGSGVPTGGAPAPVDATALAGAADWIRRGARLAVLLAPRWATAAHRRLEARLAADLALATGHLAAGRCVLLPLAARSNLRGATEAGAASDLLPGLAPLDDGAARARLAAAWGSDPAVAPGGGVAAIATLPLQVIVGDERRAVPAASRTPGPAAGCFVVVLDAFLPPNTDGVDVLLPIASFAESSGTVTSSDGRLQRLRPAARPPALARPGWQVLAELCARLGRDPGLHSADEVLDEIRSVVPSWAGVRTEDLDEGWGARAAEPPIPPAGSLAMSEPTPTPLVPPLLTAAAAVDWSEDPLVAASPTLSRDPRSLKKLFPRGVVHVSRADADALGLRTGRTVRLATDRGEVAVPVVVAADVGTGTWLVPAACRSSLAAVLGEGPLQVRIAHD